MGAATEDWVLSLALEPESALFRGPSLLLFCLFEVDELFISSNSLSSGSGKVSPLTTIG
jgi:hypothetical protein